MTSPHPNITPARHWKDIPQEVSHRAMSSEGRRRAVFATLKTTGLVVILAGLGWGAWQVSAVLRDDPKHIPAVVKSAPLKDLVLVTDGALDQAWLARTLAVPKGAALMTLDLFELRARLLKCGQVRAATVTRNFPATLAVTVSERPPVARLQVEDASGARTLFVGRDGVVFEGINLDPKMVESLPWLSGARLTRQAGVFLPLANIEAVADLLAKAKLEAEHLYSDWRSVSLARLASDGEIEVTTKGGSRVLFSTREDYFRQLAMLDSILDTVKEHPEHVVREIDLTVGGREDRGLQGVRYHVPVSFTAVEPAPASERDATSPARGPHFTGFSHP